MFTGWKIKNAKCVVVEQVLQSLREDCLGMDSVLVSQLIQNPNAA
jgi:hypothetical protein